MPSVPFLLRFSRKARARSCPYDDGVIFLDANDEHWIVARDSQELFNLLVAKLSPERLGDLYRLAAAALDCEEDSIAIIEQ